MGKIDKDSQSISITDNGIGMTADEIKKYINQVAFSSAEEFIEKYKGSDNDAKEAEASNGADGHGSDGHGSDGHGPDGHGSEGVQSKEAWPEGDDWDGPDWPDWDAQDGNGPR